ncbi:protein arginine N-methyltransferase 2 isoform X2 [Cottoperca gobio]|uniref:type I protein arginine methyltransferase n=1 Tax=Cottoperca gobio TaxID=56716 RepID=A0A6J2RZ31_COTGO|nr:protein arginine N-methyltransferase 2 isoform X2 [Cottoperca gobio]
MQLKKCCDDNFTAHLRRVYISSEFTDAPSYFVKRFNLFLSGKTAGESKSDMQTENEEEEDASVEEYVALTNYTGSGSDQLSFSSGDTLLVHSKPSSEWWWAELKGDIGYVPASYLRQDAAAAAAEEEEEEDEDPWQDEEYFGSYGKLRLHLEMLSDKSRTEAYRQVILSNSASLRNKVVIDLGCGTGIISLFCAQLAQPSEVFAVEASSMAEYTRQLVKQNGCEAVVTVLQGRAEEIELPERVDVLVSEWMGNCLLFEFMVESVLVARDRWLKEGGVMWPSSATLTLVPCQANSYYAEKMAFWEQPYGLDFTPLQPLAQQEFFTKPKFSHLIEPDDCLTTPCDVLCLDMYTLQVKDLEVLWVFLFIRNGSTPHTLVMVTNIALCFISQEIKGQFHFCLEKSGVFHGFTAWFTVHFESLETGGATVELNTGPNSEPTHWKQTLFMLDRPVSVFAGDSISGNILLRRNSVWRRHMTVTLHWSINSSTEETDTTQVGTKSFPMWR